MGIPGVKCKRLTAKEVEKLESDEDPDDPMNETKRALLKLLKEDKITAWLYPDGQIRYQYKPESIRGLPIG